MLVVRPGDVSITQVNHAGMTVYRGTDYVPEPMLTPDFPVLDTPEAWADWSAREKADRIAYDHVVYTNLKKEKRPACRSLSCSMLPARYYATAGYTHSGYVNEYAIPPVERIIQSGLTPALYFCGGGIVLLEARRWTPLTRIYQTDLRMFEFQKNCAIVDDELLLVCGKLELLRKVAIDPGDAATDKFLPWPLQMDAARAAGVAGAEYTATPYKTFATSADEHDEDRHRLDTTLT